MEIGGFVLVAVVIFGVSGLLWRMFKWQGLLQALSWDSLKLLALVWQIQVTMDCVPLELQAGTQLLLQHIVLITPDPQAPLSYFDSSSQAFIHPLAILNFTCSTIIMMILWFYFIVIFSWIFQEFVRSSFSPSSSLLFWLFFFFFFCCCVLSPLFLLVSNAPTREVEDWEL